MGPIMAIVRTEASEAREFLDKVLATPYPLEEKAFDVAYFVTKALSEAIIPFQHPITVLANLYGVFSPNYSTYKDTLIIDEKKIEKLTGKGSEALKEKFLYIKETTDR